MRLEVELHLLSWRGRATDFSRERFESVASNRSLRPRGMKKTFIDKDFYVSPGRQKFSSLWPTHCLTGGGLFIINAMDDH